MTTFRTQSVELHVILFWMKWFSVRGKVHYSPVLYVHQTLVISEDGSIVRHDGRESPLDRSRRRAQNTLQLSTEITDIEYHPYMDHFFVTSDSQGSVYLRDERMAFGPLSHRSQQGVVLQVCRTYGID